MQACRILRNPAATSRAGVSINSCSLLARSRTSPLVHSDHGKTLASVAASEPQALHEPELPATRKRVSILLQKTVSLLPRTLSTADSAVGPSSSHFWSNILERSITELYSGSDQVSLKATIAGERVSHYVVHPFIPDYYRLVSFLPQCSLWFRQVGLFT